MSEDSLTPNQSWLLLAIRREGRSLTTMQLKADMGVANLGGAGLDESRLLRDLAELTRLKLVKEVGGLWEAVVVELGPVKGKKELQGTFF